MAGATWNDAIEIQISDDGGDFVQQIDIASNVLQPDDLNYPDANRRTSWWKYAPRADGTAHFNITYPGGQITIYAPPVNVANKAAMRVDPHAVQDFVWDSPSTGPDGQAVAGGTFTAEAGYVYIFEVQGRKEPFVPPMPVQLILTGAPASINYGPTVILDPFDRTVELYERVEFRSLGAGRPAPTVQWQIATGSFADWENIVGATSTTFSLTALGEMSGYRFRAKWSNSVGVVYSEPAVLTVNPGLIRAPLNVKVPSGKFLTLAGNYYSTALRVRHGSGWIRFPQDGAPLYVRRPDDRWQEISWDW